MSVYDKLFQLQLRLKQNKVNQQRKRYEVKRLCQSYENQVYHLLYLLYNFSNHAWYQLNQSKKILNIESSGNEKADNNYSDIFMNISKIPVEVENKTKSDIISDLSEELSQLCNDLKNFTSSNLNEKNFDSPLSLPIEAFLLILSLFNFFWSRESSDLFISFMRELDPKDSIKFIQCIIIHPSVQMYFTSALKPIFYQISSFQETQNTNFKQALLDSLLEFSPLIPYFMKIIFTELKIPNDEKPKIFYEQFLRIFLVNFSTFGIFHCEITLFHKDQIYSLIESLDQYFNIKDNQKEEKISPDEFLKSLFSNSQSICVIPNEERLMNVSKGYCPATLVDKRSIEFIHNRPSPLSQSSLNQIPSSPIFFVPHSPIQQNLSTNITSRFTTDSAINIASRILLKADLIHVEDTDKPQEKRDNNNQNIKKFDDDNNENSIPVVCFESSAMKPFEYFEKIVDLSFSRVADPQVEVDLDKLEPLVQDMTLEELCQLIETELSMIELSSNNTTNDYNSYLNNIDQDDDIISTLTSATSAIDPLQRISLYSTQFSLINKISAFIKSQITSSTDTAIFILVNKFISNFVSKNPPARNISESKEFCLYYQTAFDDMMNINSQIEGTNSSLSNMNSFSTDNLKINSPINANNPNSRIINSSNNLSQNHSFDNNRSKTWANIQPDFVTHRNFHSCLSFKLDLFNKIKARKENIDEANTMKSFLVENREKLIDSGQHQFLQIFVKEPQRLKYFNEEFEIAFSSSMPFVRVDHIHQAYQSLIGLLQMEGMDEIGADQITPFAVAATVMLVTSPKQSSNNMYVNELTYTYKYLCAYIEPFISNYNVLNHSEEYSLIQFLSTYQYLYQIMQEMQK